MNTSAGPKEIVSKVSIKTVDKRIELTFSLEPFKHNQIHKHVQANLPYFPETASLSAVLSNCAIHKVAQLHPCLQKGI